MYKYRVSSNGQSFDLEVNLAWLQGFYSAQLLAGTYGFTHDLNHELDRIGQIAPAEDYPFTFERILGPGETSQEVGIPKIMAGRDNDEAIIPVSSFPMAFARALDNALQLDPQVPIAYGLKIDWTQLPYHIIAQFSEPQKSFIEPEALDGFDFGNVDVSKAFSTVSDFESANYYISPSPTAENAFLVKVPNGIDMNTFLVGFLAYFRWIHQANPNYPAPPLYLHHYEATYLENRIGGEVLKKPDQTFVLQAV